MNLIDRFFLNLALIPASIYKRLGIDTQKLQAILQLKLVMDDRRPGTLTNRRNRNTDQPVSGISWGTVIMSLLMGGFYLFFFFLGNDLVVQFTLYFSILFFMLSFTLISDFTSVLIDTRDTVIILPKPVNDRTFVAARLLHIAIHLCKIVIPMSLPCAIYIGIQYGILPILWFYLILFPLVIFSIFFINAIYILIIRFVSPQKFQGIINYLQIFFTIILFAGYQLLPRAMSRFGMENYHISEHSFFNYYPPFWSSIAWNALTFAQFTTHSLTMLALALLIPFLCLWIVIKYLAPHFNSKLALISSNTDVTPSAKKDASLKKGTSLSSSLSSVFCHESIQKTAFELSWKLSSRSKDFRLKVLPMYGYTLVYAFMIFFRSSSNTKRLSQNSFIENTGLVIFMIYSSAIILITVAEQMNFSEKYRAAWLWLITPIQVPGSIIIGTIKAMFIKYYLWLIAILAVVAISIWGFSILPNMILALLNQYFILLMYVYLSNRRIPFSNFEQTSQKSGSFIKNILRLLITGIIGVGHYFIASFFPVVILCIVLIGIAIWILQDSLKKTSWPQIFYAA